jgi:predicted RNA-binding protein YlqC (UPF0109 family)
MAEVKDQDFLEYIVKTLVDHPDDVIVNRDVDEMGVLLTVKVNPEDMGQLIGRQGSTARAIRSLVKIIGLKNHARVNLKIEEPEGSTKVREERREEKIEDVTDGLDDLKI